MRDEDEVFADIVKQEFGQSWTPAPAPAPPAEPVSPAGPDFHLNLFDDDESYRAVGSATWQLSRQTRWGLSLIALGLVVTIIKFIAWRLPDWLGWLAVAAFVAGTALCLWRLTHLGHRDDADSV
jgi:hypothetical protein